MTMCRAEILGNFEREVGVMVCRIRRVIGLRACAVHPDFVPASYLMLIYVAEHGLLCAFAIAEQFDIDKGAVSRQVTYLTELGLLARVTDFEDGRAMLVSVSDEGRIRLTDVARYCRKWLDECLGDWSDADLIGFVETFGRYNRALDDSGSA